MMQESKNPVSFSMSRKYEDEYPQKLYEYFTQHDAYRELTNSDGTNINLVPNKFPTIERFALMIGVTSRTLRKWRDVIYAEGHEKAGEFLHPEWREAYYLAQDAQMAMMNEGTFSGAYNSAWAAKFATNIMGWKDKQELEVKAEVKSDVRQISKEMSAEDAATAYADMCKGKS